MEERLFFTVSELILEFPTMCIHRQNTADESESLIVLEIGKRKIPPSLLACADAVTVWQKFLVLHFLR